MKDQLQDSTLQVIQIEFDLQLRNETKMRYNERRIPPC